MIGDSAQTRFTVSNKILEENIKEHDAVRKNAKVVRDLK
jgi:hypothetical protein